MEICFLHKNNKYSFLLFKYSLFFLLLNSMFAWFTWNINLGIIGLISLISCVFFIVENPSSVILSRPKIISILLFIALKLYCTSGSNLNGYIGSLFIIFIISVVIALKNMVKYELFMFFTKAFSLILLISLFTWGLLFLGFSLPHFFSEFNDGQYSYDNYYFFLHFKSDYYQIPRFSSIFLEAGHLGMITSFFLYVNNFNVRRKEVLILLIANVLTFSLAAYILLFISMTFYFFLNLKKGFKYIILWACLLFVLYIFFQNLNNGNNVVNNYIFDRLIIEDGEMVGNNRTTENMDFYFKQFVHSNDIFFGINSEEYNLINWGGGNAGYKLFVVKYGLVGILLILLFYYSLVLINKSKFMIALLFIYIISFLQRSYALWEVELLIFIIASAPSVLCVLNRKNDINNSKNISYE